MGIMRIRPTAPRLVPDIPRLEHETPTADAVACAGTTSRLQRDRDEHARHYHFERLETRLRSQYRVAAGLGVLTLVSVVVSLGLSIGAGPAILAALWVIPSGLAGSLVSQLVEIDQTRAAIREVRAEMARGLDSNQRPIF